MPTTELTPWLRAGLWCCATALAGVSIVCEVLLFADQTNTPLDHSIAVVAAAALVGCQYGFAGLGTQLVRQRAVLAASAVWIVTLALLAVSISGSAGFFESRFQASHQEATQTSTGYQLRLQAIDALDQQSTELTAAAQASRAQGNSWYAGQLLEQAQTLADKRQQQLTELSQVTATGTTSSAALAMATGDYRWALWWLLAALIDLCPLLVFAILIGQTPAQRQRLASAVNRQTPQTPAQPGGPTTLNTPSVHTIKTRIRAHELGNALGIRAAMRAFGTSNYPRTKQAFDELIDEGFLKRDGQRFWYAQTPSSFQKANDGHSIHGRKASVSKEES